MARMLLMSDYQYAGLRAKRSAMDGGGDYVRVCPLACRCFMCSQGCSEAAARRNIQRFLGECERLGVGFVSMLTVTVDGSRFGWDHLKCRKTITRLMGELWGRLPAKYRAEWGEAPLWWCGIEVQPSTGNLHAHLLVPAPSYYGRLGYLRKDVLLWLDARGFELSGRVSWGWDDGTVAHPVKSPASTYISKAAAYPFKGVESVPAELLAKRRWQPFSRSRGVTAGDTVCKDAREARAAERAADAERWAFCDGKARECRERRAYDESRRWAAVRDGKDGRKVRAPLRTQAERIATCGRESVVFLGDQFLGKISVPFTIVRRECFEEMLGAIGCAPDDWDGVDMMTVLGLHPGRPSGRFWLPREHAAANAYFRGLLPDSSPCPVLVEPLHADGFRQPATAGEAENQKPVASGSGEVRGRVDVGGECGDVRFSVDGFRPCAIHDSTGQGAGRCCSVLATVKQGGFSSILRAVLRGMAVGDRAAASAVRPQAAGGGRPILVRKGLTGTIWENSSRAPPGRVGG